MMMNILSFAGKYFITDLFDKLENVLFKNLTIYNFDVMLRCVEDIANQEYFIKFANFFKLNEDEIIKTEEFAALPRPLVIKLCKAAYQFKTELDVFFYMLETGIDIDLKQMPITTLPDFFKVISYATQHGNHEVYHAAILKFSPVFETRYKDYYLKKLEIPGFNFETVEAVLNTFYDWPGDEISVELAFDVLRLCEKYDIMHVFDSFEEVMERNLSPDNFFEVLQFAHDCTRRTLFAKSAAFYKINEDAIKNTEAFLALPGPLIVMLLKSAYNLETELDVFFYARDNGIHLDMEHIEVKTALDFFRSVPYAWHHHEENLKLKCAIFWRENKDILGRNPQYQQYPNSFEHELDVLGLGNDDFINDDIDDAVDVYGIYDMNFDDIDDVEDVDNDDDDDDDDDFFHL
uniref:BTB domain-containing protein n=1 Tax=Panagrellus redivivus TaxID=6233 RepID=A0A7E4W8F1_PANRE